MTVARAPGKLVLSGAYVVLEGAPALVLAVDRFVVADTSRPVAFETEEVKVAVRQGICGRAVGFDASALRSEDGARKLGLGSSAAILVASMLACPGPNAKALLSRGWIDDAVRAHRDAQGGGSGVDVVASAAGGVVHARLLAGGELEWRSHALPAGCEVSVWSMGAEASTRSMLERVRALASSEPATHRRLYALLDEAARGAASAGDTSALCGALGAQARLLAELGDAAGAPIVPRVVRELAKALAPRAAVLPSGAGGGDVVLAVSAGRLSAEDDAVCARAGLGRVRCALAPAASIVAASSVSA